MNNPRSLSQKISTRMRWGYHRFKFSRLTYENKLMAISLVFILGILLLGAKTYQNSQNNLETYQRLDHTRQVLYDAEQISAAVKDLELGVRGYVITGDYTFLEPFYTTRQTIFTRISNLKNLSGDNVLQKARLDSLKSLLQVKMEFLETSIQLRKKDGAAAAENFIISKPVVNRNKFLFNIIEQVKADENKNLAERKQESDASNRAFSAINILMVLFLVFMVVAAFMALWHNTQASMKAKALLENNKQILQSIIDNTSSIIYVKDMFGRFALVNKQFAKTYGINAADVIGKTMFDISQATSAQENTRNDDLVIEERRLLEIEENAIIDGREFHYYSIKFPLINRNDEVYAIAAISTDITDIIQKQNLIRQKEIIENKIEAQENERKEIGIELHDNISQLLASAKMMLDTALFNVERKDERLEKARNDVYSAINETRKLSHSLVLPKVSEQQITTAIEELTKSLWLSGKMKLDLRFNGKRILNTLDDKCKLTVYRIIQEQVNNIMKYSRAKNVMIYLDAVDGKIQVRIGDDGVGFDASKKSAGIGFRNIASRIKLYGGNMKITSAPGQGCMLEVQLQHSQPSVVDGI